MRLWYGSKVEKHSRKFSVKDYWRKPNSGKMIDDVADYIIGLDVIPPPPGDDEEVLTDDLVLVEGGGDAWSSGGRIHYDEAKMAIWGWVCFCLGDILEGVQTDRRGKDVAPAKTITVSVSKFKGFGGFSARFTSEDKYWDMSMMLLRCLDDNHRVGPWSPVSLAKRTVPKRFTN